LRDVTVHSGVLVIALVHNGRAECITDFGIDAGKCVVELNAQCYRCCILVQLGNNKKNSSFGTYGTGGLRLCPHFSGPIRFAEVHNDDDRNSNAECDN